MSGLGRHVIAIDLPGYGRSPPMKSSHDDRGSFLESAIKKLCGKSKQIILVSPAVSGLFSLPLLKQNQVFNIKCPLLNRINVITING